MRERGSKCATFAQNHNIWTHCNQHVVPHQKKLKKKRYLVVFVVVRVLRPQVGQEVAGEEPVEPVEEGVEPHLHVHLLGLGEGLDVLVAPGRQAAEHLAESWRKTGL